MVVGNVYGNIDLMNFYAQKYHCDTIMSTGNLGVYYHNETSYKTTTIYNGRTTDFGKYLMGKDEFKTKLFAIRGRFDSEKLCKTAEGRDDFLDNFHMLKNSVPITYSAKDNDTIKFSGIGGRYSAYPYNNNSSNYEYFTKNDFEKLIQNTYDIVLLHDVIGGGSSKKIIFGQEIYEICKKSTPKFIFLGQYDYQAFCPGIYDTNFVVCPSIAKGFHILDTDDWNLYFIKQIYCN